MKIFRVIILGLWIGMCACSEDQFSGYSSDSYIYFTKESADSTVYSFAYDKTQAVGELRLKLNIVSDIVNDRDRNFAVRFLPEKSTAVEGVHFELLDGGQSVKAADSLGFFTLKMKRGDLNNSTVLAVFKLVETGDFKVGLRTNSEARVVITDQLSRPEWWNDWHETSGLGMYTREKYQAFIDEMKVYDLTQKEDGGSLSYSEVRVLVLSFKRKLEANPRPDADGSPMTVAMRG